MPSVPARKRLPAVALVLLAAALVAWSGWFVYDDFRTTYALSATPVDDAAVEGDVLPARDLPPDARRAFERARDGEYVVHHEPDYLDTFPVYESVYVRADGTVYELWARVDGVDGLSLLFALPTVLFATGLGALGWRSYRRTDARTPLAALAGLGGAAATHFAWSLAGPHAGGSAPVAVAVVVGVAAAAATWIGVGRADLA